MTRYAILVSKPIQYLVPLFQALEENKNIKTEVWYNNNFGVEPFFDSEFNKSIKWDFDILNGYRHVLLKNFSWNPSTTWLGQINPGIIKLLTSPDRPDILILWGWDSLTHLMAVALAPIFGVKLYLRAETTLEYESSLPLAKRIIKKIILRLFFNMFDGFLYLGTQNRAFYEYIGICAEKLYFMPYCTNRFSKEMSRRKLKKIRKFLFVGKLSQKKRPDIVIEAFKSLCLKHPKTTLELTIVGDGEMRPEIEKACDSDSRLNFYGFANQGDLQKIYQTHDAIVLPSDERETWGLVINEGLASGLAAITSDRVGCRTDLIKPGGNGGIFSYGNVDELTTCMHNLVDGTLSVQQIHTTNLSLAKIYNHDVGAATLFGLCND